MNPEYKQLNNKITITKIVPDEYIHTSAFDEVIEGLKDGLTANGFEVNIQINEFSSANINIIIGAHLLKTNQFRQIPNSAIIYNFEQIDLEVSLIKWADYISLFRRCNYWDYSKRNIELVKAQFPSVKATYVPVGYSKVLTCIDQKSIKDIDVLFYGSINERRKKILDELKEKGLNVCSKFGIYGKERDNLISRSKVILNHHFYKPKIMEVVRVSYLMANSKAVVCEYDSKTEIYDYLRDGLYLTSYENLVSACVELVNK